MNTAINDRLMESTVKPTSLAPRKAASTRFRALISSLMAMK